ncbi:unnamed protein product [Didymodactylos carnosus]|uniref:Uncharacterized protein n=1 Tax=Didymodactylos carnosus TaxID=1234261 RepID=A0A814WWW7_9BILA|nr:unnamed protein product [Didymodactylos carnosus]CAF1207890.1 unnamed protein product [Didymodactylos carnosus]CAF3663689.1 unnamed protein product [Didymodactylos carnosus]CAF3972061.1 unnamed protein product [Didymodactylos carnosus]
MPFEKTGSIRIWALFSAQEKRNIAIYVVGLMFYKFGLEAFNGSIVTLATNRYEQDAFKSGTPSRTFEKVGLLSGLNQAFQCIGSILIAPLTKRWPTRTVLSISIFVFALFTAILMIVDSATGGRIKPTNFQQAHEYDYSYYGRYNTNGIIPIYCITGVAYGMVELIRRVIPRDIVGDNDQKLKRMDALVHIFYEIAGVSGAFTTGLGLIPRLGNNYSFIITPIFFTIAAIIWLFIRTLGLAMTNPEAQISSDDANSKSNYFVSVIKGFILFGQSIYIGGKIIFINRKFIWLWSCYSLTLYAHRYLENGIAPQIAQRYLGNSAWSQIIVGGSNFGELLGAVVVFFLSGVIKTPIPWSRLDALILLIVWYIPYYYPPSNNVKYAWIIAATYIPIGFGSSIDDISLNAYIQSSLSHLESKHKNISALGAVVAFLYSSYIIIYAIANPLLGKYLDSVYQSSKTVRPVFVNTVAIQLTIISVVVFVSTFIPKGAITLNPSLLQENDSASVTDSVENTNVMFNKNRESGEVVRKGVAQGVKKEMNSDMNTYF